MDEFSKSDLLDDTGIAAPNAKRIYLFGIISIPLSLIVIGLIFSIIALNDSEKVKKIHKEDPFRFSPESLKQVKTGKTCAIISVAILHIAITVLTSIITN